MKLRLLLTTAVFLSMVVWAGCSDAKEDAHADHSGHAHSEKTNNSNANESHDHEGHDHEEPEGVMLSPQSQKIAGISVQAAMRRTLQKTIELPGRIGYNEDRLMHITPRYAGVARTVRVQRGQYVKTGYILAEIESNQSMSVYSVKAPFSGYIVEKRVVPGEHVAEDRQMFVLADLSNVWVNCDIFASNMDYIKTGTEARVLATGTRRSDTGTINYVAPHFNSSTNSGLVRIVLPNRARQWRPGMFIRALIAVSLEDSVIAIERDAVQTLDGETVVFLPGPGNTFKNQCVKLGRKGGRYVEVLNGLNEGDQYVAEGAFEIKATIVTSGMDPHAGHGH
ncbi:MAG: efflux RND transporter periplasmic adaptor subunit [Chitinispirillaceae bacterium]|nr:efflux RND transporter periplasmic adaptor subunit [Chitinispirillaceae bacterium]